MKEEALTTVCVSPDSLAAMSKGDDAMRNRRDHQRELSVFIEKAEIVKSGFDAQKYITVKVSLENREYLIRENITEKPSDGQKGLLKALLIVWSFLKAAFYN
jgi:hypothetical protein